MNKNIGHFQAFTKSWFDKHQRVLITLLNHRLTRRWFRWVLRIRPFDCPLVKKINRIEPNSFSSGGKRVGDRIEITTDFRTHNEFAKRLYFAFKPVWWAMHAWDTLFANRFAPQLNFGFDSLEKNPDAHPETNTVDGDVERSSVNQTLADIRAGAGTDANSTATGFFAGLTASSTTNQFSSLERGLTFFDTSSLTASAEISKVVWSGFVGDFVNNFVGGTLALHIAEGNAANTNDLVASDFAQINFGTTSFGSKSYGTWTPGSYNDITLNASGVATVSKTGITKLSQQLSWDINNNFDATWSDSANAYINFASADLGMLQPKLVITYTLLTTATGNFFALF